VAQQASQLGFIQPVPADDRPVDEQYRHVQTVTPPQQRVAVYVQNLEWRERQGAGETRDGGMHLLAQLAVAAPEEREPRRR